MIVELLESGHEFARVAMTKPPDTVAYETTIDRGPTLPQLYIKGEFIGGCDIVREMSQSGELAAHLADKGIACKQPAKA